MVARHLRPVTGARARRRARRRPGRAGRWAARAGGPCCASGRTPGPRGTTCSWRRWPIVRTCPGVRVRGLARARTGLRRHLGQAATAAGVDDRCDARARSATSTSTGPTRALTCSCWPPRRDLRHGRDRGAGPRAPRHRHRRRRAARGAGSRRRRHPARDPGARPATRGGWRWRCGCWLTDPDLRDRLRQAARERRTALSPAGRTPRHGSRACCGGGGMSTPGGRSCGCWVGGAVVAFLVHRLGTGPFVDGVRLVDASSLAAAAASPCRRPCAAPGGGAWSPVASASGCRCDRGRRLLPVAVPQHGAARGSARGRPPRRAARRAASGTWVAPCGPSSGSAPPGRSCRPCSPSSCCSWCRRSCSRSCRCVAAGWLSGLVVVVSPRLLPRGSASLGARALRRRRPTSARA